MDTYYFEGWTLEKGEVELAAGRTISNKEFKELAKELQGLVDSFYDEQFYELTQEMAREAR